MTSRATISVRCRAGDPRGVAHGRARRAQSQRPAEARAPPRWRHSRLHVIGPNDYLGCEDSMTAVLALLLHCSRHPRRPPQARDGDTPDTGRARATWCTTSAFWSSRPAAASGAYVDYVDGSCHEPCWCNVRDVAVTAEGPVTRDGVMAWLARRLCAPSATAPTAYARRARSLITLEKEGSSAPVKAAAPVEMTLSAAPPPLSAAARIPAGTTGPTLRHPTPR